jgi:hypothetical protein
MPLKKGTLQFLQDAYTEITAATIKSLIGPGYDPSIVYILNGILNTGTLPTYTISAGSIFYNGEVFDLPAASFSATGLNIAIFQILQTQYTTDADPVTFTDSTARNIHNIRQIQVVQGLAGTGISNYDQAFFLNFNIPQQVQITAPTTGIYANNYLTVAGAYPNVILYAPTPTASQFPVLLAGNLNIGDIAGGNTDFTITFPSAVSTSNYIIIGCAVSNGTPAFDSTATWSVRNKTVNGFAITFNEGLPNVQNISWDWIIIKTS